MTDTKLTAAQPEEEFQVPEAAVGTAQSSKTADIEHSYWLMTQKMGSGDFYKILKQLRDPQTLEFLYDCILAVDFGHGQTTACVLKINNLNKNNAENQANDFMPKAVPLDDDAHTIIPTMIGFNKEGKPFIGWDANIYPEFYQAFKKHPGEWSAELSSDNKTEKKTYKDLMSLFFKKLFRTIFNRDKSIKTSFDNGKLLICVGCPTSDNWLNPEAQAAFAKLVSEAAKSANNPHPPISVVAESTAALMTGLLKNNLSSTTIQKFNIGNGIAIFDFGSSTIDFTYILPGGIIITKSKDLGGYKIDKTLQLVALRESGQSMNDYNDSEDPNHRAKDLLFMRMAKEAFYRNPEYYNEEVNVLNKRFRINKDTMRDKFWASKEGVELLNDCSSFVSACHATVRAYGCENVLVSGGTGMVTEFKDIVIKEFKESKFIPYKTNASLCVAEGLALMEKIKYLGQFYLKDYRNSVERAAKEYYKKTMKNAAAELAPVVMDNIKPIVDKANAENRFLFEKELIEMVDSAIKNNSEYKNCMDKIAVSTFKFLEEYKKDCKNKADKIQKKIYDKDFDFVLKPSEDITIHQNSTEDPYRIAINQAMISFLYSKNLMKVLSFLFGSQDKAHDKVMEFSDNKFLGFIPFVRKNPARILNTDNKKRAVEKLEKDIYKKFKKEQYIKTEIESYFKINAEVILGKVMLYVYDNHPQ